MDHETLSAVEALEENWSREDDTASSKKILVIDVGGAHVKALVSGHDEPRMFNSGPTLTPTQLVAKVREIIADWRFDVISIGYPGTVAHNKPIREPHNLGGGWVRFNFAEAFGCPVKIVNDAALQALGNYKGGKMLFLGLGTGLGSAMIVDGIIEPMELAHLPYKKATFETYLGNAALKGAGKKKWRLHVKDVVQKLIAALEPDDVAIGGGNAKKLKALPPLCRAGDNANAFAGGFRLWDAERSDSHPGLRPQKPRDTHSSNSVHKIDLAAKEPTEAGKIAALQDIVFLFDVDNTLLDNDRVQADLKTHLEEAYGVAARDRYWAILEDLRSELGYIDYLGALERFRLEAIHCPEVLRMSSWLVDYAFASRLYPGAVDTVNHVKKLGCPVILSDGDAVFQPRKVERSGLWDLFDGRVLIYVHKEQELDDIARYYPARHYVLIDDKLRILTAVKKIWKERVTTVFVKQGHYAREVEGLADYPPADLEVARIGDLMSGELLISQHIG
jgi:polyphosphate glucokinase